MDAAGGMEKRDWILDIGDFQEVEEAEVDGELGAARAVAGVGVFVVAAGIVEEGEEADDLRVGGMVAGEFHAVAQDGEPMGRAVVGGFGKAELGDDELSERNFVGEEEGEIVGWVGRRSHGADHFAYLAEAGGSRCPW